VIFVSETSLKAHFVLTDEYLREEEKLDDGKTTDQKHGLTGDWVLVVRNPDGETGSQPVSKTGSGSNARYDDAFMIPRRKVASVEEANPSNTSTSPAPRPAQPKPPKSDPPESKPA
jgi:hypothetical protein